MTGSDQVYEAIAFAARAHRHQVRKDGETPYVSHVFRVCLVLRQVFVVDDPQVLTAAVLHDTIEDTATDYDDVAEQFGTKVADWVAMLTKEMRLPEATREANYHTTLAQAPWPVVVCKLADIYDNLLDSKYLPTDKRAKTLQRVKQYLDVLQGNLTHPLAERAYHLTLALWTQKRAA